MNEPKRKRISLAGLADVQIREDGEEVLLTCKTSSGEKIDIGLPAEGAQVLGYQLMAVARSGQIKAMTKPPADVPVRKEFLPMQPLYFVNGMTGIPRPNSGALDLVIEAVSGHKLQLTFMPEQIKVLFDNLLQVYNPDAESSPS